MKLPSPVGPAAVVRWALLAVPLAAALVGPVVAGSTSSTAQPLLPPGGGHPLGTDTLGRDVLALVLTGGVSVVSVAGAALLLAYAVGVPLALATAGQPYRWIDTTVVRVLDVLLALPGLLVLMVLAATGTRGVAALTVAVAVLQLPAVVRLVRSAVQDPGCRTAMEAMTLQGERWWRIHVGLVGRTALGPLLVDAGHRMSLVLYLISSANFLGLGLDPSSSDWAVLVERNQGALFVQPWAVMVPAALLVMLCTGANLVVDHRLANRRVVVR